MALADMGQQIRFYTVYSDFRALLRYAEDGGLLALPQLIATEAYDRRGYAEAVLPLAFQYGTEAKTFYLLPREIPLVEVFYHELGRDPSRSRLADHVSPVIEIVPCRRQGEKLYHGRIYINAPRQGPGSDQVYKAYQQLAQYIRNWSEVAKGVYAGPTTSERMNYGEVRLMVINRELQVENVKIREHNTQIEWIEIPKGEFLYGVTSEQRSDIAQRLYQDHGIQDLDPELKTWLASTLDKPKSAYSDEENEIWRREVLRGNSPALAYQHALWTLDRLPEAKGRLLSTFYIARFPITRAQADLFYASDVAKVMGWQVERGVIDKADRPAMFQRWDQAQALAHWLGGRLPTPVEWEKAARGTGGRLYPWGDTWNPAAGHFRTTECHRSGNPQKRTGRLTAVDAYPEGASPYGVMDMVGNLAEWHALNDQNDIGKMGFSIKEMRDVAPWFYALPMHCRGMPRWQNARYVGCRPVLDEWGRRLWPGYDVMHVARHNSNSAITLRISSALSPPPSSFNSRTV